MVPIAGGDEPAVRLSAPFLFTGRVMAGADWPVATPLLDVSLAGRGVVTMGLALANGRYSFESLDYVFQSTEPIPEPAALLLVGTGVATLAARRKRVRTTVNEQIWAAIRSGR